MEKIGNNPVILLYDNSKTSNESFAHPDKLFISSTSCPLRLFEDKYNSRNVHISPKDFGMWENWLLLRSRLCREVKDFEWFKWIRDKRLLGGRSHSDILKVVKLGWWLATSTQSLATLLRCMRFRLRASNEDRWDNHLKSIIFKSFSLRLRYCKCKRFSSWSGIGPIEIEIF